MGFMEQGRTVRCVRFSETEEDGEWCWGPWNREEREGVLESLEQRKTVRSILHWNRAEGEGCWSPWNRRVGCGVLGSLEQESGVSSKDFPGTGRQLGKVAELMGWNTAAN